jgi:hypothetical protein
MILKANTPSEMNRIFLYAVKLMGGAAEQVPDGAGGRWNGLEAEHGTRRQGEPAGKIHGLLLLRMDLHAEQHEPAPQRLLQGLREGAGHALHVAGFAAPVDLWDWMDAQRKAGNELLAISHNANLSDGRMYPTEVDSKGRPIDAAYAASADRNER